MLSVAVLGYGTVGSGVVEILTANTERVTRGVGQELRLKYIVDVRDFPDDPHRDMIIKDFSVVEKDPEVAVVVETIGGVGVAYDFTKRSMLAGKSVVTSNKELVATHGSELLGIAKEKNVGYMFEASVGGGIPILRPINQCLAANNIYEIYGILNGTTNYILTEMFKNGESFEDALKCAQKLGYAEADPTADIEGMDANRKICILSDLCFGSQIDPDLVSAEGIRGVTAADVELAGALGYKIKLLGRAMLIDGGTAAYVSPHLISMDNLLAGIEGVMNGIVVKGDAIGKVLFCGPGAGKMPTASAVVADVIDAARHISSRKTVIWGPPESARIVSADRIPSRWYVRVRGGEAAEGAREIATRGEYTGFVIDECTKPDAMKALEGFEVLSMFRLLD